MLFTNRIIGGKMKITDFKKTYKKCFPVGEGWRPLVTKLVEDIIKIDKTVEISQTKEKHGGLSVQIWNGNKEVYDLIYKAEQESFKTCEHCGTKKNVTTEGGWLLTLCSVCKNARKQSHSALK